MLAGVVEYLYERSVTKHHVHYIVRITENPTHRFMNRIYVARTSKSVIENCKRTNKTIRPFLGACFFRSKFLSFISKFTIKIGFRCVWQPDGPQYFRCEMIITFKITKANHFMPKTNHSVAEAKVNVEVEACVCVYHFLVKSHCTTKIVLKCFSGLLIIISKNSVRTVTII